MADTNSASRFGSASLELKKELLSRAAPQNTKSLIDLSICSIDFFKLCQYIAYHEGIQKNAIKKGDARPCLRAIANQTYPLNAT